MVTNQEPLNFLIDISEIEELEIQPSLSEITDEHKVYFYSDPITVSLAEFDLINSKIIEQGFFLVAPDHNHLESKKASVQSTWKLAIQQSLEIISWDNNAITFKYSNLLFTTYHCEGKLNTNLFSYCHYLHEDKPTFLQIFIRDNACDYLVGSFTINQSIVHTKIDLKALLLPIESQGSNLLRHETYFQIEEQS